MPNLFLIYSCCWSFNVFLLKAAGLEQHVQQNQKLQLQEAAYQI